MTDSPEAWVVNHYPLVEARFRRADCLALIEEVGLPRPEKSACVFCPFHDDAYWRTLRDEHPADWASAVAYDEKIRDSTKAGVKFPAYLHRSLVPLRDADISDPHEDQIELGFGNECAGVCGV